MIQRFFNARRFFDADKGGIAGAAGQSDEAANSVSAGEENTGADDAFLNALGFDAKTRAALAPKREKQPAPEQPETPEAKEQVEEDDDEAPLQANAGNEKMLKRINKLTARLKAAEAEAAALKAKPPETPATEAKPAAKPAANADDVFAGVETREQLNELVTQARQTEAWFEAIESRWEEQGEDNIEVPDGNGGTRTLTPAQVKAYAKRASRILRDRADAQDRIAAREQAKAKAAARFSWLAKPDAERSAAEKQAATVAEGIRANAPEFARFADSDYIINPQRQSSQTRPEANPRRRSSRRQNQQPHHRHRWELAAMEQNPQRHRGARSRHRSMSTQPPHCSSKAPHRITQALCQESQNQPSC